MEPGITQAFITLLTIAVFVGICVWAYRPGNASRFEEDALLPFADDDIDERTRAARDLEAGR